MSENYKEIDDYYHSLEDSVLKITDISRDFSDKTRRPFDAGIRTGLLLARLTIAAYALDVLTEGTDAWNAAVATIKEIEINAE